MFFATNQVSNMPLLWSGEEFLMARADYKHFVPLGLGDAVTNFE